MTSPVTMTNCPTADETLAAFIDGRLQGEARLAVLEHLSTCSACRDVFQTAHEIGVDAREPVVVPIRRSWIIPATLAAAAAIAAAIFLGPTGDGLRRSRNLGALTAATAGLKERPMDARPSIDIAYKRHRVIRSGRDSEIENDRLLDAARNLAERAEKRPVAENLHAAGLAFLLAGSFDEEAVRLLEEAKAKTASPGADLLNDLAAAHLETGDVTRAKAAIERAWQLKKSANIAWTRAVILDTSAGWNDYLAVDSTSEWAAEARSRMGDQIGN